MDIDKVVTARLGRKKPPLKVLWGQYLKSEAVRGAWFYGYERFCQIVTEHVRVNDLTLPIAHVPGHTMQVDWAGTMMQVTDPITRAVTPVAVFVATLPFSGMVFAYGYLDEKQPAWCDGHRRAFEYYGGVAQVIVRTTLRRRRTRSAALTGPETSTPRMRISWPTTGPRRCRHAQTVRGTKDMSKPG